LTKEKKQQNYHPELEQIIINTVWTKPGFANPMKGFFNGDLKQRKENPVFAS